MENKNAPAPIVMFVNVEELVDAAWSSDPSLLPALSSKAQSPIPSRGEAFREYRRAYEDFVLRLTETANRLAQSKTPGQDVVIDAGDVLRPWWKGSISSLDNPLFEESLDQTPLPTRDDII